MHLALLVSVALFAGGQTVTDTEIVDHDYRFVLTTPGTGWKLLPETESRRLAPDTVAALINLTSGVTAFFAVIAAGGVKPEEHLRSSAEAGADKGVKINSFDRFDWQDVEAVRARGTCERNGVKLRYEHTCYLHEEHLYQVIVVGIGDGGEDPFKPVYDAFRQAPGALTPRLHASPCPDMAEGAWRVLDGVYRNAAYGLSVKPSGPWRLLVGVELAKHNSSATVGLQRTGPNAWVLVVAERVGGVDRKRFVESSRKTFLTNTQGEVEGDSIRWRAGDTELEFLHVRSGGTQPTDYYLAHHFHGGFCFQIQANCLTAFHEVVLKTLPDAMQCVTFLTGEALAQATRLVEEVRGGENEIGATYALRGGRYRDFEHGFAWSIPKGWWNVRVGSRATDELEGAILYVEEEELGILGAVLYQDLPTYDAARFHDAVVSLIADESGERLDTEPRTVDMGARQALLTRVRSPGDVHPLRYSIASTIDEEGHAIRFVFWGFEDNVRAAESRIEEALRSFSFPEHRPAASRREEDGTHHDERMGFRFRPPEGWKATDQTPEGIRAISTFLMAKEGKQILRVTAVFAASARLDLDWIRQTLLGGAAANESVLMSKEPKETDAVLSGRPCRQLTWESEAGRVDTMILLRGRTAYTVTLVDLAPGAGVSLQDVAKSFELLD